MLRAQFRIQLPAEMWVAAVSQSHPTATFRLLSGVRMDETALELGDVKTDRPVVVSEAIKTHESVDDYEELAVSEDRVLAKYETTDTGLYAFVEQASLPPEFPITVQDGWYVFDLTGTRTEFDRLRAVLEQSELSYELLSLVEDGQKETLLTDRQQEVLSAAIQRGYFAVPRDCTLSDLADTFDADKFDTKRCFTTRTSPSHHAVSSRVGHRTSRVIAHFHSAEQSFHIFSVRNVVALL